MGVGAICNVPFSVCITFQHQLLFTCSAIVDMSVILGEVGGCPGRGKNRRVDSDLPGFVLAVLLQRLENLIKHFAVGNPVGVGVGAAAHSQVQGL